MWGLMLQESRLTDASPAGEGRVHCLWLLSERAWEPHRAVCVLGLLLSAQPMSRFYAFLIVDVKACD